MTRPVNEKNGKLRK